MNFILTLYLFSCTAAQENVARLCLVPAFPEISFIRPVDLHHEPDNNAYLYVVEQAGKIYSFKNIENVQEKELFLDLTDRVNNEGNEEGLLGLAFDPDFKENGYIYVDYTAAQPRRTVISRLTVNEHYTTIDKSSEYILLEIEQPYNNHNGGQISFGPDGFLYIAMGDGGSAGDPDGNGQNRQTLLGAFLRIDVTLPGISTAYQIPADNPYVGNSSGFREEIYADGLRNPRRFRFDIQSGEFWAGDFGQNEREEINIIRKGENYGWKIMEGTQCYDPRRNRDQTGLTIPVHEYTYGQGYSITGGFVYRGLRIPKLSGSYVYADYVTGKIWALKRLGTQFKNILLLESGLNISSFGIDAQNELYLCAFDGKIYKIK